VQVQATSATGMFAAAYSRIAARPHLLWDNARSDIHPRFFGASTFARMVLLTTADTFGVEHVSDMYSSAPGQSQLVVRADGRYLAAVSPPGNDVVHVSTVTLPGGTAEKRVEVISGSQYFTNGSWLRAVYVPASASTRLVEPVREGRRLAIYGDSISCGYFTTLPPTRSWPQLLRSRFGSVTQESSAGRQLHDDATTTAALAELVRRLSTFDATDYWLAIGTNDWGNSSWTAAAFGSAYQSLLDNLHAAAPRARIYCQSPLVRSGESTPNGNGEALSAFRAQINSAAAARPAFTTYVDGTSILSLSDLPDGVHPDDATTSKYADYVNALLGC
jgi:lysophospholipase L1-like esterase